MLEMYIVEHAMHSSGVCSHCKIADELSQPLGVASRLLYAFITLKAVYCMLETHECSLDLQLTSH